MELLRIWGLERQLREGAMRVRPALSVSETLVSAQRSDAPFGYPSDEEALAVSPTRPCYCAQDHLDPVLLEHLLAYGGQVRFSTEMTRCVSEATGVTAELSDRSGGRAERVRARYQIAWVRHSGCRVSTLDLFDGHLTVLTGLCGGPWRRAAADLAAEGLPIVALSVGDDLHDQDGGFAGTYRLGDAGAMLVRPDGYIAWRRPEPVSDPRAALRSAVGLVLGRPDAPPALLRRAS